jgi:hypothetical protein
MCSVDFSSSAKRFTSSGRLAIAHEFLICSNSVASIPETRPGAFKTAAMILSADSPPSAKAFIIAGRRSLLGRRAMVWRISAARLWATTFEAIDGPRKTILRLSIFGVHLVERPLHCRNAGLCNFMGGLLRAQMPRRDCRGFVAKNRPTSNLTYQGPRETLSFLMRRAELD